MLTFWFDIQYVYLQRLSILFTETAALTWSRGCTASDGCQSVVHLDLKLRGGKTNPRPIAFICVSNVTLVVGSKSQVSPNTAAPSVLPPPPPSSAAPLLPTSGVGDTEDDEGMKHLQQVWIVPPCMQSNSNPRA